MVVSRPRLTNPTSLELSLVSDHDSVTEQFADFIPASTGRSTWCVGVGDCTARDQLSVGMWYHATGDSHGSAGGFGRG